MDDAIIARKSLACSCQESGRRVPKRQKISENVQGISLLQHLRQFRRNIEIRETCSTSATTSRKMLKHAHLLQHIRQFRENVEMRASSSTSATTSGKMFVEIRAYTKTTVTISGKC